MLESPHDDLFEDHEIGLILELKASLYCMLDSFAQYKMDAWSFVTFWSLNFVKKWMGYDGKSSVLGSTFSRSEFFVRSYYVGITVFARFLAVLLHGQLLAALL